MMDAGEYIVFEFQKLFRKAEMASFDIVFAFRNLQVILFT